MACRTAGVRAGRLRSLPRWIHQRARAEEACSMPSEAPMPPVLFGKYRLLKKLAQGGMAEIFLAKATGAGGFEKTVIVKRILPRLSAHDKFVRMFINEAKVTSVLSHSNIVQIFD